MKTGLVLRTCLRLSTSWKSETEICQLNRNFQKTADPEI